MRGERKIIMVSRVLSAMFNPFYLPVIGLMALFTFSYLNLLPVMYKLYVLMLVYIFTVLLPTIAIRTYRNYHGWTPIELGVKERRMIPYIISIICYFLCYYVMNLVHIPRYTLRSDRWCGWCADSLLTAVYVQPSMVAVSGVLCRRTHRYSTNDTPSAYPRTGCSRIPVRSSGGIYSNIILTT